MNKESRLDLLMKAYDCERQDERAFWSSVPALTLTAFTVVGSVTLLAPRELWVIGIVAPILSIAIMGFWGTQSAIGTRRRRYMEALEVELSKGEAGIEIDEGKARSVIRPLAFNRYSLSMLSNSKTDAAEPLAIIFFSLNHLVILAIPTAVAFASFYRLAEKSLILAWILLIITLLLTILTGTAAFILMGQKSRKNSWKTAPPISS